MKRIYLIGKSKDGRKLHLAQKQGAKFPSMELPLTPKVLEILREIQAERLAGKGKKLPEAELEEARRATRSAETRAKRAGARAQKAWERQREAEDRAREAEGRAREAEERAGRAERQAQALERTAMAGAAREDARRAEEDREPEGFEPVGDEHEGVRALIRPVPGAEVSPDGGEAGGSEPNAGEPPVEPPPEAPVEEPEAEEGAPSPEPRERRDLAPDSTLSPAEIQALLRAGRGIRSVAQQAEAPIDWVRRLAAPIESERLGAVTQLLRSYVVRSRLGRSALPVGPAMVENLREKGVRFPERIVEEGWAAWRPDGREWRVRFVYESRGRRQRADWHFDPQTREVHPQNTLAQELGFRPPAESGNLDRQTAEVSAVAIRPRGITGGRSSAGSSRPATASAKESAKRTAKRSSKKAAGKRTAKRSSKKAAGKRTAKRSSGRAKRASRRSKR